jgi:hypothetical protein
VRSWLVVVVGRWFGDVGWSSRETRILARRDSRILACRTATFSLNYEHFQGGGEDAESLAHHTNALQELQNIIGRWPYSSYFGYLESLILSLRKIFLRPPSDS